MAMPGWAKGVAFVNGFNLGWYWPQAGPQMTLYIPGPMLRDGENELILLEVEQSVEKPTGGLGVACSVFLLHALHAWDRRCTAVHKIGPDYIYVHIMFFKDSHAGAEGM